MNDLNPVEVAVSPVEKFREYLATRGQRMTHERSIIVDEIFCHHEHFDADQLIERVTHRDSGNRVSRSTVYRTLASLEDAGLIRKVARPEGREVYEHDYGYPRHDHFICDRCGELIEFHNDNIAELLDEIAAEDGFVISTHRLEVHGTCVRCSRPPKGRHHKLDLI